MNWEEYVRRVTPYVPGEQPGDDNVIKLNTNENPYPPCPSVERLVRDFCPDRLRLYPDPDVSALTEALAGYYGVKDNQVFVGVGSDDVLAMSFMTFFNSDRPVLFPDVTYSFYPVWCEVFRIPYRCVPLDDSFRLRPEDYYGDNGGIVLANPNAPTGISEPLSCIEDILEHNRDSVCIIDEAYVDFGGETALSLVDRFDNLMVVRTYSKSRSLAGSRIGFAIAGQKLISNMRDVRFSFNSYTMDSITQAIGVESLADDVYFKKTVDKIIATREQTAVRLRSLGFYVLPSSANFLFVTHPTHPADELFAMLKENNIYVRYFKKDRIDSYLRITIGTDGQMSKLTEVLEEYIQ